MSLSLPVRGRARRVATGAILASLLGLQAALAGETDTAVYDDFGQLPGIEKVVDNGVDRILKDPRINDRFKNTNIRRLKRMLTDQFCEILAGPCRYKGRDMAEAHAQLGLRDADFNALVEDFQNAMDDNKVPFRAQNKLLAHLAPMHRDVVTR